MLWIKIGIGVGLVAISVLGRILRSRKRKRLKKMQVAAYEILKEEALNHALKKQFGENDVFRLDKKLMINLEGIDLKLNYVFNPDKAIIIGRAKDCTMCLNDPTISSNHCEISMAGSDIIIKDLGAANKAEIKRGYKKYTLRDREIQKLYTKDIIKIGNVSFKVTLFRLDKKFFNK